MKDFFVTFPKMFFHMKIIVALFCLLPCALMIQEATSLSSYLLKSFHCISNETFNHFTVSDDGQVYAGAKATLYHLSKDFEIQSQVNFQSEQQPNINKILEVVPAPVNQLISCGTGFEDSCQIRNLDNITNIVRSLNAIRIAPGSDSVVGLIVTHSDASLALYIGQSVREEDRIFRRPISTVCLFKEGSEACRVHYDQDVNSIGGNTAFNFYIKYACVFTYKGYTYFVTSQKADATVSNSPVVPKLSRVCHNDKSEGLSGFTEVTLECKGKGNTTYSIAQSAQEVNDQLFIVFSMNNPEDGYDFNPANQSALCVYEMDSLVKEFEDSAINCSFRCNDSPCSHSSYISESSCEQRDIALVKDTVGFVCSPLHSISARYPERSPYLSAISGFVVFEERGVFFSSIVISQVYQPNEHYVAFIGTSEGKLLKIRFEPHTTAVLYEVLAMPYSVLSDTWLSGDGENLMILTKKELLKLTVTNCSQFQTCDECIKPGSELGDPYCGWCTLERRCTRYNMCNKSDIPEMWVSFATTECLHIIEVHPMSVFTRIPSQAVVIKVAHLPRPDGFHYRCHFGQFISVATFDGATLTCQSPHTTNIPKIPERDHHKEIELAISSSAFNVKFTSTPFYFFDCSRITGCTECVKKWACDWCIDDLTCVYESEHSCINITSDNVNAQNLCPQLIPEEKFVPSNVETEIELFAKNFHWTENLVSKDYICVLTTREDEFITKASIELSRSGNNFTIRCSSMQYNYQDSNQETRGNLCVRWQRENVQVDVSINVTLYKCHVGRPDCSRCLSNLTTRHELRCGWCARPTDPFCGVREICQIDLKFQCTDPPHMNVVWPINSPVEGGTIVEINGTDLGQRFSDIKRITLAGVECNHSFFTERYKVGESVKCQAGSSSTTRQGKIVIYVKDVVAEDLTFTYTDPVIGSFSPTFGPASGGSLITIRGSDLQTGSNITAHVGDKPCYIMELSSAYILCKNSADQEGQSFSITVTFDGKSRRAKMKFEYHQDPAITSVNPMKAILSGGNKLTVTGQRLHLIQRPKMTFSLNGKTAEEKCTIVTSEEMICLSPNLNFDLPTKREVEADGAVEVGFIMDDVTNLLNWSKNAAVEFLVFRDPEYYMFENREDYDNINEILTLEGKYLDLASSEEDVAVFIGNSSCIIISLLEDSVICKPPLESPDPGDFDGNYQHENLPFVVVLHGNTRWNIGFLRYKSDLPEYVVPLIIVVVLLIFIMLVGGVSIGCVYRKNNVGVNQLKKEVKELETNYYGEMRQLFTNLRTTAFDCEQKIHALLSTPAHHPDHYFINFIFEGENLVPLTQRTDRTQTTTAALLELLRNEHFLKILIQVLEEKDISFDEKKRQASLVGLAVLLNDQQALLIQVLTELVIRKMENGNQEAKNLFKRGNSVVEELLSNWVAVIFYVCLGNVAKSILQVHGAIKYVCELGPIDAICGKSQFSINDQNILQAQIDFNELKLEVLFKVENDQKVDMHFLDVDTITEVKSKILDHFYGGQPFSIRRTPNDYDLVWQCKDGRKIIRDDGILLLDKGWRKLNVLGDYKVSNGECVELVLKQDLIGTQLYAQYNLQDDAKLTKQDQDNFLNDKHGYLILDKDGRPLTATTNGAKNDGCYVTEVKGYESQIYRESEESASPMTKHYYIEAPALKRLNRESEVYEEPEAGFGLWKWHLVKNEKLKSVSENNETGANNTPNSVNEIVLPYLPATKNAIQKYVSKMFSELLSSNEDQIPVFIKMLFDIFDEQAVKIGRPELARSWKNNVLPLGLWKSLIEKPSLLYDIEECNYVRACLMIITDVLKDICSTDEIATKELSPSKQLYSQDIPSYKVKLEQLYGTIQSMAPVTEGTLKAECEKTEKAFKDSFDSNAIMYKLNGLIQSYTDEICIALNRDEDCQREDLAGKLQRIATMRDENEGSVYQKK